MARNGSGTYNLPAGNPVVTGTTISSTTTNNTFSDIATALTGSISKDGQTTPTGNLPMGGFAHTGVADATVRTQYGTAGQIQDSAFTYLTSPAGTNAITATASLGMSAYVTGQRFFFVAAATNTGACTLNINAIGVKSVTKNGTTALVAGDIAINAVTQVVYDGTQFQLLNPASVAANVSSFSAGSTGLTPSTATTGAVTLAGTLAVANGGTGQTSSTGSGAVVLATSPTITSPVIAGTPTGVGVLTSGTAVSASGTSIDFTSIPSWVKRITVMFNGVSTSSTSNLQIQIGSGSIATTGYVAQATAAGTGVGTVSSTTGFILTQSTSATDAVSGNIQITLQTGSSYISTGILNKAGATALCFNAGLINLAGTLDRVRITTVNGTDTFDAGNINIMYE